MVSLTLNAERLNLKAKVKDPAGIFQILGNLDGLIIGDIGSGGGYFAVEFAQRVGPLGFVHAIDVSQHLLKHIDHLIQEYHITNMDTLHTTSDSVPLARGSVDMFFIRNAFHHLKEPAEYFRKLYPVLKSGGRLAIIDYLKPSLFTLRRITGHYSSESLILDSLQQAGYNHSGKYTIFSDQSFNIFVKP